MFTLQGCSVLALPGATTHDSTIERMSSAIDVSPSPRPETPLCVSQNTLLDSTNPSLRQFMLRIKAGEVVETHIDKNVSTLEQEPASYLVGRSGGTGPRRP